MTERGLLAMTAYIMKLLIITQKVDINDDVLGFMHDWIAEFAKVCERVTVICLEKGEFDLPNNVKVLSLGKEIGRSRIKYVCNFYKYIREEKDNYGKVFVHMNQQYVLLGGLFWKIWHKRISFWYAHGSVSMSLKIAERISDVIFTSTQSGFRTKSNKVKVVGQGIDVKKFKPELKKENVGIFRIITIGRISPVKDYETLIKAIEISVEGGVKPEVKIIGGIGMPEQEKYLEDLKEMVKDKKLERVINFFGAVPNKNIVQYLQSSDLFVNMSYTGSLDKAILEAMACGLPVLTCNEALIDVLGKYQEMLVYSKGDYKSLAEKMTFFMNIDKSSLEKIKIDLREIVIKDHSLGGLIKKFIEIL
jgi:glycosyltransferase involved in cell wall biosynthesis